MCTLRLQCVVLLLHVLFSPGPTSAQEPVAVITPLTYTAYLDQPAVRFHCFTINACSVAWHIDGFILHGNELKARGIETTTNHTLQESNLTISSTIENNNTRIRCLARHLVEPRFVPSEEVVFFVQGLLGKCPGLQIIPSGNYHQRLTWDPPSTLNITAVEPDISSYIVCSNISAECTTINVTESGGDSSHLWQYIFLNLRAYINFTVTAVNIVGDGESASIVSEPCAHPGGESSNQYLSVVVSFDSENIPSLSVKVMSQRRCFDVYLVHLEGNEEVGLIESNWIIPSVNVNGSVTLNVTTNSTLNTNMFYRATLITTIDMMEAGSFEFSTYDVQDVELHGGRGNITIRCVFASGSQARGSQSLIHLRCHVEIRNSSIQMNISRSGSPFSQIAEQTVTGLTPGSYEVFIFDWERDGSVASTPSYVGNVNIKLSYVGHVNVTEPEPDLSSSVPPTTLPSTPSYVVHVNVTGPEPAVFTTSTKTTGNDGSSWYLSPTTVICASVGSTAAVLLLAIIVVLIIIACMAVLKPKKKAVSTEDAHYSATKSEEDYSTVKTEEPYYSTVNIKRPDACIIELGKNSAYEIPPQLPQRIEVEENPAYASVNGQA